MNWIKNRLLLILGGLLAVSVFLLKIFGSRMKRLKKQKERLQAHAERVANVMNADLEIEEQTRSRRTDALKELQESGDSELFNDPSKLRDKRRN